MKDLTAKDLRDAFGKKYPVINHLIKGKPDDYCFSAYQLLDREDYIATKLWSTDDIKGALRDLGYRGTQSQVSRVLGACRCDALEDCTDGDWQIIEEACHMAGFDRKEKK